MMMITVLFPIRASRKKHKELSTDLSFVFTFVSFKKSKLSLMDSLVQKTFANEIGFKKSVCNLIDFSYTIYNELLDIKRYSCYLLVTRHIN